MIKMVTKKRIQEIRNSKPINIDKEMAEAIEEGDKMSRENSKLFREILD